MICQNMRELFSNNLDTLPPPLNRFQKGKKYTWYLTDSETTICKVIPGCHWVQQISSQCVSRKLLQGLVARELAAYLSVFDLFLTQWIMAILSKGFKPDNRDHTAL